MNEFRMYVSITCDKETYHIDFTGTSAIELRNHLPNLVKEYLTINKIYSANDEKLLGRYIITERAKQLFNDSFSIDAIAPQHNEQQLQKEFEALCQPLVDYLYTHGTPHSSVIITQTSAELVSCELGVNFKPRD